MEKVLKHFVLAEICQNNIFLHFLYHFKVQMVKSAENPCFSQICIFICQNHMFWHFLYYFKVQMVKSAEKPCFSQSCLFLC